MPRTSKTLFLYPIEADGSKLHVVLVTQHKQISGPAVASGIMMSSKKKNEARDDKMTFAFLALNTESISIKPSIVSTDCSDDLV